MIKDIDRQLVNKIPVTALSADRTIVFIDAQVEDYQTLATGVIPNTEVVILSAEQDGILQISEVLRQKPEFNKVHIVSHGSPGCLYLGKTKLSLNTLDRYTQELQTWFSFSSFSLEPSALLLYGCNVAAGDAGEEFIAKLRKITGAEIAASTTPIGNEGKGGNWRLDITTNNISFDFVFSEATQEAYSGVFVTVSGTVFIDYDNDGVNDGNTTITFDDSSTTSTSETGADTDGIIVTAYRADGTVVDSDTVTGGTYSLDINEEVRIEFTGLPDGYSVSSRSSAAVNTVSNVLFADGSSNLTADFGIIHQNEFVDSSITPKLITSCYVLGSFSGSTDTAIVSVLHTDEGQNPANKISEVTIGDIGSVYGLAYNKETGDLFAGAFQKRFSDVGPSGNGAIYRITNTQNTNAGDNGVSTFIDLDQFYSSETNTAGAYSHGDNQTLQDSIDGNIDWTADKDAFDAVGKVALGDVEISGDRQHIWTINLADRQLYKVEIGDGSDYVYDGSETRTVERYDILSGITDTLELGSRSTQSEVEADIRPFALAEKNGLIYVGLVDSAETSQETGDLHAYVYTFNPNTESFAKVLDFALDYERQNKTGFGANQTSNWTPWVGNGGDLNTIDDDLNVTTQGGRDWVDQTQPILADIEFDNNGDMILGFRDRTADQIGGNSLDIDGTKSSGGRDFEVASGGDIVRASLNGSSWTIESGATDSDPDTEIYDEENYGSTTHEETAQGGLTQIPGYTSVETTALDPERINSGGLLGLENGTNNGDGDRTRGIELFVDSGTPGIRKANGLGDLEAVTDLAPIEIGDRIWNDTDGDGIQDAGEDGIDGVNLSIYNSLGTLVGQTTTNNGGEYYFNDGNVNLNAASGLEAFSDYEIRVDSDNFISGTGALDGLNLALTDVGNNDIIDSDAINNSGTPTISLTTDDLGTNDHDYDIGFTDVTFDYGDAPDISSSTGIGDYQTTASDSGANHLIANNIFLGNSVDADDGTLQNAAANADDSDSSDDEDGVTFVEGSTIGNPDSDNSYSVEVIVDAPSSITSNITVAEDDFDDDSSGGFAGGTGWSSDWIEDESNGAGSGDVQEDGLVLEIRDNNSTAERDVIIPTGATNVTLSFDFTQVGSLNDSDEFDIEIDDGTGFTVVDTIIPSTASSPFSFDITTEANTSGGTTTIRFNTDRFRGGRGNNDGYDIDNVEITADIATSIDTTLVGWIDFDRDGSFQSDEGVTLSTDATKSTDGVTTLNIDGSTANTLTWDNFNSDFTNGGGTTYARFRVSSDSDLDEDFSTGLLDDGEVEDYKLAIAGTDYGDAPDDLGINGNYGTTSSNNGASHGIVSGLSIGSLVDEDDGSLEDSTATADDNDGLNDEDGISTFPSLKTDDTTYSITIPVTNTVGTATLIGWIDFDGNGTFEDTEAVTDIVNNGDSFATLTWNSLPSNITAGDTFARFRLSTDTTGFDITTPTGAADDGEVEDYTIAIAPALDYGDAPDSSNSTVTGDYQTTTTNSGNDAPSHVITDGLRLGGTIDSDDGTLQNSDATADDSNDTGSTDDEDGVTLPNSATFDSDDGSYSVTVNVTNTGSQNVTVVGWIDFDQSGTFDADEAVSTSGVLTGNQTLTWSNFPDDLVAGDTFARFRLSTDSSLTANTPTGALSDGEIEDYQITINGVDYGDAPDDGVSGNGAGDYNTVSGNSGAAHNIISGLSLGSSVDADNGTLQNNGATADDSNDGSDDEDGVTSFDALSVNDAGSTYSVTVDVNHTTGTNANLIAWIDFDGDGLFESTEASNLISGTNIDGTQTLNWTVPSGGSIASGTTYVRLRLSDDSLSDSTPTGLIGNGEVEDYSITIGGGTDFGDAPDTNYNTSGGDNPASHEIVSGLSIGDAVDSESDGVPGTAATGDDTVGIDDEDGVTFINTTAISNTDTTYSVEVIVNSPGGSGTTTVASDDFSSGDYTGGSSDGNGSDWAGDWTESGDNNNSATGNVQVNGGVLQLRNDGRSAQRSITIPAIATGTIELSFDYAETGNDLGSDDPLQVVVGSSTFTIPQGTASGIQTLDITSAVTPGNSVTIEFNTDQLNGVQSDDGFDIDDVTITATSSTDTILVGWIDFDGSGIFEASEGVSLSTADSTPLVTDGVTANTLTWDGGGNPLATTTGDTYARFRLSTDSNLSTNTPDDSVTDIGDGEVEDYLLKIKNEVTGTGISEVIDASYGDPTTPEDDLIIAGAGQDTLTGAGGDDCYHFNQTSDGVDVITDFDATDGDKLDFSDFFATGGELEGITNPFGTYIKAITFGTGVMIQVDVDPADTLNNKNLVLLKNDVDGVSVGDIDASDFIF